MYLKFDPIVRSRNHTFLVRLQFVVYDLTRIYTLEDRNEPGANANQSFT
jgi:hypothetical protein